MNPFIKSKDMFQQITILETYLLRIILFLSNSVCNQTISYKIINFMSLTSTRLLLILKMMNTALKITYHKRLYNFKNRQLFKV